VANLLKKVSINASETAATEDQSSDANSQSRAERQVFELNVTEEPPTADQLKTILEYAGRSRISSIVKGAGTETEAMRKFTQSQDNLQRPLVGTHSSFL